MKISIGADHRGLSLKQFLIKHFSKIEWNDCGTHDTVRTDYPLFAKPVCKAVVSAVSDLGILICGSGIGMAIAANRCAGIYAGVCWNEDIARVAREHDGLNVLVLPSDFVNNEQAVSIVTAWLAHQFKGGRHQSRLNMIDE